MILDSKGKLLELRQYDGEYAHTLFYVYNVAVDEWLATFRDPRKHDTVPVIYSTPKRTYFENTLARHGFMTANGQIPTPIISFWMNDKSTRVEMDRPAEIKWFNRQDNSLYPDMIPYNCNYTVSFWTRKQMDMDHLESQFLSSFNQTIRWIIMTDTQTGRKQTVPFFLEGITDASNLEPGDKDDTLLRRDFALRAECYIPRFGVTVPLISKIFVDISTPAQTASCTISYISGNVYTNTGQINNGEVCGIISPGNIYISGTVNAGQSDEEQILIANQWDA